MNKMNYSGRKICCIGIINLLYYAMKYYISWTDVTLVWASMAGFVRPGSDFCTTCTKILRIFFH